MTNRLEMFLKEQDVKFYKSYSMKNISFIGIGGNADIVAIPNTKEKLIKILYYVYQNGINYKVAGRMTNILPSDMDYHGILILTKEINRYYTAENTVTAECGAVLSNLISNLSQKKLGGMYNLYGIPGSVGGAVCGNAGAYGSAVSDFMVEAEVYSPKENKLFVLPFTQMNFSYRSSIFKESDFIILSIKFLLKDVLQKEEKERLNNVILKRKATQPYSEKSLGSVFKRKGDFPISKLIDTAGLKGLRIGDAEVSEKHAGFIVNKGNATAEDFLKLSFAVKSKILERYGIMPELEIEVFNGD